MHDYIRVLTQYNMVFFMQQTARIHLLKVGTFATSSSESWTYSANDLRAIADAYDITKHYAPIVVGHPADNHPAYGWVDKLWVSDDGNSLYAEARLCDEIADALRAEHYKKVSGSFYRSDSQNNPVPGVMYLRHIGLLGGQPPAVKGLASVAANFHETTADNFIEFQDADIDHITPHRETPMSETDAAMKAENEILRAQVAQMEAEKEQARAAGIEKDAAEFADTLIKDEKLLPKDRAVVIHALKVLQPKDNTLDFSEDGKTVPLVDKVKAVFASAKPHNLSGAIATNANAADPDAIDLSEPSTDRAVLFKQIKAYAKLHNLTYEKAAAVFIRK